MDILTVPVRQSGSLALHFLGAFASGFLLLWGLTSTVETECVAVALDASQSYSIPTAETVQPTGLDRGVAKNFVAALNGAYCEFKQDKNRQAQETLELATARAKDANSGLQANYLPKLLRGRAFLLREMGSITSAKKLEGEALAADLIKVDAGDEHSAANAWQEAYMKKLEKRIKSKWKSPDNIQDEKIVVTFKVAQDGSVSDVVVVDSDASDKAKGAALKALTDAAPFPVFSGPDPSLHIQFTFAKTIRYGAGGGWQPFGR
jgi:hypothetical protein